jgi:hypothetical protein
MSCDCYSSSDEREYVCSDAQREELVRWLGDKFSCDEGVKCWDLLFVADGWAPLDFRVEFCEKHGFRLFPCYLGADFWVVTSVDDLCSVLHETEWLDLWRTALADL